MNDMGWITLLSSAYLTSLRQAAKWGSRGYAYVRALDRHRPGSFVSKLVKNPMRPKPRMKERRSPDANNRVRLACQIYISHSCCKLTLLFNLSPPSTPKSKQELCTSQPQLKSNLAAINTTSHTLLPPNAHPNFRHLEHSHPHMKFSKPTTDSRPPTNSSDNLFNTPNKSSISTRHSPIPQDTEHSKNPQHNQISPHPPPILLVPIGKILW